MLAHAHESLAVVVVPAHDVTSRRKHPVHLAILAINDLVLALGVSA